MSETIQELNKGVFTFKDNTGFEWDVSITMFKAMQVDKADFTMWTKLPVVSLKPSEELIVELQTNSTLLMCFIWVLVQSQAKEKEIDEEEFMNRIDGKVIHNAKEVFWSSYSDFYQEQGIYLKKWLEQIKRAETKVWEGLEKKILPDFQKMVDKKIDQEIETMREDLEKNLGKKSLT